MLAIEIQDRIALVRFDRGDQVNALSAAAMREITAAGRRFAGDPAISAVVFTGARNFSLGADLKDPERGAARGLSQRRVALRGGPEMCAAWEAVDALTVCAIEGWCVGGGAALAAAFDLRVMGTSARLYVPEVARGMNMSWGSVPRITALVGPARAKRIVALCEKIDAATALDWGLADAVADDGQALARAMDFARTAAALPPTALKMVKRDVTEAALAHARTTARQDLEGFLLTALSEDYAEGVQSFLEKRPPRFTGD
jgi:enoyl-CoA hydratase